MANAKGPRRSAWWKSEVPKALYHQHARGDIVCCDALSFLHYLKDGCADIVFLDPPFNLGKTYASSSTHRDRLPNDEYMRYMEQILLRCCDILCDGGALYLYHVPRLAMIFANILAKHLSLRHWIAIAMKNGFVRGDNLYPAHYGLLYFTKGDPAVFRRPKLPIARCRKCNSTLRDYGGYKQYVTEGVNLSDYWDDISPVRHKKHKNRTANELPLTIPMRVAQISGCRNGTLVDPFAGAGTSIIAALNCHMRFVAADREHDACRIMRSRLQRQPGSVANGQ